MKPFALFEKLFLGGGLATVAALSLNCSSAPSSGESAVNEATRTTARVASQRATEDARRTTVEQASDEGRKAIRE